MGDDNKDRRVAPRAGAWIEIRWEDGNIANMKRSHPARVRGLKSNSVGNPMIRRQSHPARVRGLKLDILVKIILIPMSHPARVRGLKSFEAKFSH